MHLFIASPAKSGTTWLMQTMRIIYSQVYPNIFDVGRELYKDVPFWDHLWNTQQDDSYRNPAPTIFKTHNLRKTLPDLASYIYLARNPLDTIVSRFYQLGGQNCFDLDYRPWGLKSRCRDVDWYKHIAAWHQVSDTKEVLFLTYEEMHQNYQGVLTKLCEFCQIDPSKIDFDLVQKQASFNEMKQVEETLNHPQSGAPAKNFCRKGIVGDWKNHLRPDMVKIVYDQYYENGIDKYYGSLEDWADMHDWLKEHPNFT